jgi:glycerophosphoryl diester phosphodiesterase
MRPFSTVRHALSVALLCTFLIPAPTFGQDVRGEAHPLIIAHRGASGHRPEHTLAGYALAIAMGADYIEPDLVSTKDGALVARHENEIGGTTDVATKFASRKTAKVVDGDTVRGWFTEDFTLAELKTLRAKERLSFRSHSYDGQFEVPTFDEVLTLADTAGKRRGRVVGVYPETKHPTYFRRIGLALEPKLLATLKSHNLDRRDAPIFIQSFEVGNLRALAKETRVRLVQLVSGGERPYDFAASGDPRTFNDLLTPAGLRDIATYAFAIGANTRLVIGADSAAVASPLIANAHAAGLNVHVWTLRPEAVFLPKRYGGDPLAEVRELAKLGVDGMFGDYPDLLVKALAR